MGDASDTWSWYSPDRLVLVLRDWHAIRAATEGCQHFSSNDLAVEPEPEAGVKGRQRVAVSLRPQQTDTPSGGFEELVAIRADLIAALGSLDTEARSLVWFSYVEGVGAGELARRKHLTLWRVLQMRVDGLEAMATFLGWVPDVAWTQRTQKQRVAMRARRWEALRGVVARALRWCPLMGAPLAPCPVCPGGRYGADGVHVGERWRPADAPIVAALLPIDLVEVDAFRVFLDQAAG